MKLKLTTRNRVINVLGALVMMLSLMGSAALPAGAKSSQQLPMAMNMRTGDSAAMAMNMSPAEHAHMMGMILAAESFADPAFNRLWDRTDKQVANGSVSRTFLWGPAPNTGALQEDYAEAPGGKRLVQYYDKSRMEITNPGGDQSSPYYVTNGLIARELMTGQMQTGDNRFETRDPAAIGVAGDADDTTGPTYATLGRLTAPTTDQTGILVAASVNRQGEVRDDIGDYGKKYQASYQYYEKLTQHNIAGPFWAFLNQNSKVLNPAGQVIQGRLFDPVFYATGLPTTEAYWAQVKVAGQVQDVLVQAFERRVLTFTPSNPPAYQVEMGNVGQHYYKWRYSNPTPPASGTVNINISNYLFSPSVVTITAGTKVVWTNQDAVTHTVTNNSNVFGSGSLSKGSSYEFTFTKPGTYDYECNIHTYMRGRIIVV